MDPLSFTVSLLTVIHAAHVSIQGLRKVYAYRNAPQELDRLRAELESLEELLQNIKTFTETNESLPYCEILRKPLESASIKIASVETILSLPAFRLTRLSNANKARATWFRYKHQFEVLGEEVKSVKVDLGIRLGLITASSAGEIVNSLVIFQKFQEKLSVHLSTISDKLAISDFEAAQSPVLPNQSTRTNEETAPIEDGILTVPVTETGQTDTRAVGPVVFSNQIKEVTKQTMTPSRCQRNCSCICHTKQSFKSPWALRALLGELSVQYNLQLASRVCKCTGTSFLKVFYQFPQFIIRRYISFAMHQNSIAGPEFILRLPRVMPWSHMLWRYMRDGDLQAVQKMFKDGLASPYDINVRGRSALGYASRLETCDIAQFLLDQGADADLKFIGGTPAESLWDKAFAGSYGIDGFALVRRMLRNQDELDDLRLSTLHRIVLGFLFKDLRTVLEAAAMDLVNTVDARGRTPLFWAVLRNQQESVDLFLEFGANPDIKDLNGFAAIDLVQSTTVCKSLLRAKATNNTNPACWDRSTTHQIIKRNFNVDLINCLFDVIDCLFDAGFNIDARDIDNETPLMNAIYRRFEAVARRLIELGADVNAANISSRDSALHFTTSFCLPRLLPVLLEKGADYTVLNKHNRNIAHNAARFGNTELLNVMAQSDLRKLDLSVRDAEDKTPKDYINARITLSGPETGLHEAFEGLVASITGPSNLEEMAKGRRVVDVNSQLPPEAPRKLPGSFPD
ncbi:MAG: hypothetical protein Q9163_003028 [Psora crenata]